MRYFKEKMSNSKKLNKKTDKDQHNNRKKKKITKEDYEQYKQYCLEINQLEREIEELDLKLKRVRIAEIDLLLEKKRLERELKYGKEKGNSKGYGRSSLEKIVSDLYNA